MDHSDRMKQNLDILGLESLKDLALDELLVAVDQKFPPELSKRRRLHVFVMWLHERLMTLDVPAEAAFASEVASWYNTLKARGSDDAAIAEAFHDWQRDQSINDPTSSRRLSIAGAELRSLITATITHARSSPEAAPPENQYGNMHPDRMRLAREDPSVIELDDDESEVLEVSSRDWENHWENLAKPQLDGQNGPHDLSFLTGSNRLALNDAADSTIQEEFPPPSRPKSLRTETRFVPKKRPPYVCHRCDVPGK